MSAEFVEPTLLDAEIVEKTNRLRLVNSILKEEFTKEPLDLLRIHDIQADAERIGSELSRLHVKHEHQERIIAVKGLAKSLWPFSKKGDN
jgi:hypothetical protein